MGSFVFLQFLVAVCALSVTTTIFNKRILGFPQAIGVPIVSALLVFVLQWSAGILNQSAFISINIDQIELAVKNIDFYNFLINGVICFILTASALKFRVSDLRDHFKPISILASLALGACALIFAGLVFGMHVLMANPIPLVVLLLLGAGLGATDPIGIKGVLSAIKAPHHLMVKLEGESLFNDAVCIALFMTILEAISGTGFSLFNMLKTLGYEIVVASIIGVFAGHATLRLLTGKHEMESLILTTALLAAGSYLIALYAHASAPIACVIGGLIVGNRWESLRSAKEVHEVNHFWHAIEGIINSLLFTLIGLELFILDLSASLILGGVLAFLCLHLSRFLANFLAFSLFPSVRRKSYNGSLIILSWGGVRGAISLALILSVAGMPELEPYSKYLVGYTFIVVLLSGVVCGLGLPSVLNAFYYNPHAPKHGFAGWYQRLCDSFNTKGYKYIIRQDRFGNEMIVRHMPIKLECVRLDKSVGLCTPRYPKTAGQEPNKEDF